MPKRRSTPLQIQKQDVADDGPPRPVSSHTIETDRSGNLPQIGRFLNPPDEHGIPVHPNRFGPLVGNVPSSSVLSDPPDEEGDPPSSSALSDPPDEEGDPPSSSTLSEALDEEDNTPTSELSEVPSSMVDDMPGMTHNNQSDDSSSESSSATVLDRPTLPQLVSRYQTRLLQGLVEREQRREQEELAQAQEAIEEERVANLNILRKRGFDDMRAGNVPSDEDDDPAQASKKRKWNLPTEKDCKEMFQATRKFIYNQYRISLNEFFRIMMFSPYAKGWRTTFKNNFISESLSTDDTGGYIIWADEVVRAQLKATDYRAVFGVLRKELFKYGGHLRAKLEEEQEQATNLDPMLQNWRHRLLEPLGIPSLAEVARIETVEKLTPAWYHILSSASRGVSRDYRNPSSNPSLARTRNPQWVGSTIASLCAKLQPRKAGILRRITGMFVHSQAITRLGIDYLYNLGVCPSYDTVNRSLHGAENHHKAILTSMGKSLNRIICYDNIQFKQGVRDRSVGDEPKFHSFTTGFVKISPHIPSSGIRRSQFKPENKLLLSDVVPPRPQDQRAINDQRKRLWSYYILTALRQVFPQIQTTSNCQSEPQHTPLDTDLVGADSCLPPQASNIVTLGELFFDESTESGNIEIKRDIHLRQFGLNEFAEQWKENIFLVYGDAATIQRIQIMQSSSLMNDSEFDKAQWLLPILGLWHLRYNFMDIIVQNHFGGPGDDTSSLYYAWHSVYTTRHIEKNNFDQMHKLVVQVFSAKLIALILEYLKQHTSEILTILSQIPGFAQHENHLPGLAKMDYGLVSSWVHLLPVETIATAIQWGRDQIDTGVRKNLTKSDDAEFVNNIHFLVNVMPYLALTDAIKTGNISLLRYALKETLIIFSTAPNRTTYQYELCRMVWLTCGSATDDELADVILKESLVNTQGEKATWYEMDRYNELINFRLRTVNNARRTTSHQIERLVARQLRTDDTLVAVKDMVRKHFHVRQNNRHNIKEQRDLLWLLVHELRRGSTNQTSSLARTPGRPSATRTYYLRSIGIPNLRTVIDRFNTVQNHWRAGRVTDLPEMSEGRDQYDIIVNVLDDITQDIEEGLYPLSVMDIIQEQELFQSREHGPGHQFVNVGSSHMDRTQLNEILTNPTDNDIDIGDGTNHARSSSQAILPLQEVLTDLELLSITQPLSGYNDDQVERAEMHEEPLDSQVVPNTYDEEYFSSDDELDAEPGFEVTQLDYLFDGGSVVG